MAIQGNVFWGQWKADGLTKLYHNVHLLLLPVNVPNIYRSKARFWLPHLQGRRHAFKSDMAIRVGVHPLGPMLYDASRLFMEACHPRVLSLTEMQPCNSWTWVKSTSFTQLTCIYWYTLCTPTIHMPNRRQMIKCQSSCFSQLKK